MYTNPFYTVYNKRYIKDRSFAFDFTKESKVTLVEFMAGAPESGVLEQRLNNMTKKHDVNYVIICVANERKNRLLLDGLLGFDAWTDPYQLAAVLHELLLVQNTSKYIIFTGDCGGCYCSLITSTKIPVNALLFTTPTTTWSTYEKFGYNGEKEVIAYSWRVLMQDTMNGLSYVQDAFPILVNLVNAGVKIDIYWAKNPSKSDVFERDRVAAINPKHNLKIHSVSHPPNIHPHAISHWLDSTSVLTKLYEKEILYGQAYLESFKNG